MEAGWAGLNKQHHSPVDYVKLWAVSGEWCVYRVCTGAVYIMHCSEQSKLKCLPASEQRCRRRVGTEKRNIGRKLINI